MVSERNEMTEERALAIASAATEEIRSETLCAEPLLTACLIAYNHSRYVRQALDSVLEQRTDFPFEILVGDDCSTDGTTEILREYQQRHPERIRLLLARENLGRFTGNGRLNFLRLLRSARGRYLALLECDDYWTDPTKLARQVAQLEAEPELAGSFHETLMVEADGRTIRSVVPVHSLEHVGVSDVVSPELCFHTSSIVFRRSALPERLPESFIRSVSGDLPLFVLVSQSGPLRRVPARMSLWRRHPDGVTARPSIRESVHIERIRLWESMRPLLEERDRPAVDRTIEFHRRQILDRVARVEAENAALKRPRGALRNLLLAPVRAVRSRWRRSAGPRG